MLVCMWDILRITNRILKIQRIALDRVSRLKSLSVESQKHLCVAQSWLWKKKLFTIWHHFSNLTFAFVLCHSETTVGVFCPGLKQLWRSSKTNGQKNGWRDKWKDKQMVGWVDRCKILLFSLYVWLSYSSNSSQIWQNLRSAALKVPLCVIADT